ncbi:MAG: 2-hydroxyacyl-CoA dehydratase family protein [Lachnospiraceae bacterium]|nr:2-hydroxyacyl-CoA dehydratase family protein [Lachnospiraceae bacterium]
MQVIETFGRYVERLSNTNPDRARTLLKTGWQAQNLKFRCMPDKELLLADQYLAHLMMDTMLKPLKDAANSVLVSVFTPCELMQEVGLSPYNVEAFSCYLSASKAERAFLQTAEDCGISETLCSYHKTFIGAAQKGLLPAPRCIVYTSLACDANLLTFKELAALYQVPCFAIDVPACRSNAKRSYNDRHNLPPSGGEGAIPACRSNAKRSYNDRHNLPPSGGEGAIPACRSNAKRSYNDRHNLPPSGGEGAIPAYQSDADVMYVADQLRDLACFLEEQTGKKIDEESLRGRIARSRRTLENYDRFQKERVDKYIPEDLVSPMYCGMTNNILLGTKEEEEYTRRLLAGLEKAGPARGKRIYWMHTIPFWSQAVKDVFLLKESAQIVGCELAQVANLEHHSDDPYEEMAMRLLYNSLNGSITRRIEAGIRHAKETKADGVIWFNHWGCKHTLGGSQLAKKKFEAAGIPTLILDGDGCDRSHGGEGQTSTRLGAFLEMLNGQAEVKK